ncbi:hypothetical protein L209DRAFT_375498 [Thermothelomyces heterothallicus CBS 203.75]
MLPLRRDGGTPPRAAQLPTVGHFPSRRVIKRLPTPGCVFALVECCCGCLGREVSTERKCRSQSADGQAVALIPHEKGLIKPSRERLLGSHASPPNTFPRHSCFCSYFP